jgi:hypothetical protein
MLTLTITRVPLLHADVMQHRCKYKMRAVAIQHNTEVSYDDARIALPP